MVVVGTPNEFTHEFTDSLNGEIGSGAWEDIGPSEAGTYDGGGGGGGGVLHLQK